MLNLLSLSDYFFIKVLNEFCDLFFNCLTSTKPENPVNDFYF